MHDQSNTNRKPSVILVVDDERRYPNHPQSAYIIYALDATEALACLEERQEVDLQEIWLDFVLRHSNIVPVLQVLIQIGKDDPLWAQHVTIRTTTSNATSAELIKEKLSPYYPIGPSPTHEHTHQR
jgi:hypothetical protein